MMNKTEKKPGSVGYLFRVKNDKKGRALLAALRAAAVYGRQGGNVLRIRPKYDGPRDAWGDAPRDTATGIRIYVDTATERNMQHKHWASVAASNETLGRLRVQVRGLTDDLEVARTQAAVYHAKHEEAEQALEACRAGRDAATAAWMEEISKHVSTRQELAGICPFARWVDRAIKATRRAWQGWGR